MYRIIPDGFYGTGKTIYTNAQDQADKLADYMNHPEQLTGELVRFMSQ